MNHIVKPIMGRQLPTPTPTATPPIPNNLQEECIRVNKVYDWVVLANSYRNKIAIPADCQALVDAAIRAGQDITFSCVEPVSPAPSCSVVGIRRETIVVGGTSVRVGVVNFVFSATVQLTVFADGTPLCTFATTVQFDQEVVLCLPEPLDEHNIVCRISALECNPSGSVLLGGMVQLDVIVCVEIQVEAEVKLEVLAKFCSPRPNNIPVPSPTPSFRCPPITFPPQCPPIFPVRNCDCQASVNALVPNVSISIGIPLTVAIGTIQLIADICPSCDPSSSSFTFNFFDTVLTDLLGDQSFSFSPSTISSPTCITVLPGLAILLGLTVTGTGVRTFTATGVQETLTYSLTLAETALGLPDIILLTLTDQNGVLVFTATITVVPDTELIVRDCITFGDIVITTP
ncbi:hypothetical protein BRE01_48150 [Brevibacillus reuszeri]|uniref:Uncharacterized protein n=1 Tax=Brevibacillus reuszeri TaxID=54915 RepID=A0A0K9YYL0_9BACL|nr:hypothetical protein [Brevibacillus reuszeri]KNB73818.1 hypothetical protein ADS79_07770 [Brevibacillus reuszeri]MED1860037.1 hypothetical protein [Brevibacillus reuszeri]GED71113.1 hypothetical protein BRE01_48150 [Brevibacillus reuszeri]